MKRYDFDDDQNEDDDSKEFEDSNFNDKENDDDFLEDEDIYEQQDMIKELEISFQESQTKTNTIKQAVKICSYSFFWRFYSYETKLKMIEDCYKRLLDLGT